MSAALPPELARLLDAPDPTAREAAWAAFVRTHSKLLLHVAHSRGGGYDSAMDRYAYLLEQLQRNDFRRLRGYAADGRSKFSTWLVVVARRLCLDHARQRYGRVRTNTPDVCERDAAGERKRLADLVSEQIDLAQIHDSDGRDPESELAASEVRDALESALTELEPRDRLLLALRFNDELSAQEIASAIGYPTPFHVYRRLTHLFEALRRELVQRGVEDPVL